MATSVTKIISLDNLADFYAKLKAYIESNYLGRSVADTTYATVNGNSSKPFKASQFSVGTNRLSISSGVEDGSGYQYVEFSDSTNSVRIALSSAGLRVVTNEDLATKANSVVAAINGVNYRFTTDPAINVLRKISVATGDNVLFSPITGCAVGDIVYVGGYSNVTQSGLYLVKTAPSPIGASMDDLEFIEVPSVYSLYYSVDVNSFYTFNGNSFDEISVAGGSTIVIDDDTYEPASAADITSIINGTYPVN